MKIGMMGLSGAAVFVSGLLSVSPLWAMHSEERVTVEEVTHTSDLLTTWTTAYTKKFKEQVEKHHLSILFLHDDWTNRSEEAIVRDPWAGEEVRIAAIKAFQSAVQQGIDGVATLSRAKQYGRRLTTAEVKMQDGQVQVKPPSLNEAVSEEDSGGLGQEDFRSSLGLVGQTDLGFALRSRYQKFESRLTYYLIGQDTTGASLIRRFSSRTSLELGYRWSPEEDRVVTAFKIAF